MSALVPDTPLVSDLVPSESFSERRGGLSPKLLILHYTGLPSTRRSIEILSDPRSKVSCHYVIDETGRVTQMVAEEMRAWQAGVSFWRGETDINSASIGIEIQNPGHAGGYPQFPDAQMDMVVRLSRDICTRRGISPDGVLAHSDIAPKRKIDPGEKFDWRMLASGGVGHWVEPAPPVDEGIRLGLGDAGEAVRGMQARLSSYGYEADPQGNFDLSTQYVVIAFQRHFRPARVDGVWDESCAETLERLIVAQPAAVAG